MNEFIRIYDESRMNRLEAANYSLVALKNESAISKIGVFSSWIDFADDGKKEKRKIDLVNADGVIQDFKLLKLDLHIINSKEEMSAFFTLGGYAIIDHSLLAKHWDEITQPIICSATESQGFIQYSSLPQKFQARVARDKYRGEILDRDNYQCRVCGSSPDDSPHVRLEVHHIKPWEEGGLTIPDNLITLCKACHDGVVSFDRYVLYRKIGIHLPYQAHTFFSPGSGQTTEQKRTNIYFASNVIEIHAPRPKTT